MADFRIPLPDREPAAAAAREVDWNREPGVWTVSEREYGSSTWQMGMNAGPYDLGQILIFFRMLEPVREEILARMSPGECVLTHISQTHAKDLLADLCRECGEHWLVYRLEHDQRWHLYGRTCNYAWHRGMPADPRHDDLLASLISGLATM